MRPNKESLELIVPERYVPRNTGQEMAYDESE